MRIHHRKYAKAWSEFQRKYVGAHIVIAEKIIGRRLPAGAQVHHVFDTLVICPNQAYHRLLHTREEAFLTCGDPNKRKCSYCKLYDDVSNLFLAKKVTHSEGQYWHRSCANAHARFKYKMERQA